MRKQKPIKGSPRVPMSTYVIEQIEERIRHEQEKFGVSRSFVIATALAYVFNIKTQPDYNKRRVLKVQADKLLRKV